jgi:hypothetical protein
MHLFVFVIIRYGRIKVVDIFAGQLEFIRKTLTKQVSWL